MKECTEQTRDNLEAVPKPPKQPILQWRRNACKGACTQQPFHRLQHRSQAPNLRLNQARKMQQERNVLFSRLEDLMFRQNSANVAHQMPRPFLRHICQLLHPQTFTTTKPTSVKKENKLPHSNTTSLSRQPLIFIHTTQQRLNIPSSYICKTTNNQHRTRIHRRIERNWDRSRTMCTTSVDAEGNRTTQRAAAVKCHTTLGR